MGLFHFVGDDFEDEEEEDDEADQVGPDVDSLVVDHE